jgi:DNA replication licensing factor MCM6
MEARTAPRADESGEAVKSRFHTFLTCFLSEADEAIGEAAPRHRHRNTYEEQIMAMIRNDKTTIYVNFADLNQYDRELAEAIQLEYYRFEPFLRKAVQDYVGAEHRDYVFDMDKVLTYQQ